MAKRDSVQPGIPIPAPRNKTERQNIACTWLVTVLPKNNLEFLLLGSAPADAALTFWKENNRSLQHSPWNSLLTNCVVHRSPVKAKRKRPQSLQMGGGPFSWPCGLFSLSSTGIPLGEGSSSQRQRWSLFLNFGGQWSLLGDLESKLRTDVSYLSPCLHKDSRSLALGMLNTNCSKTYYLLIFWSSEEGHPQASYPMSSIVCPPPLGGVLRSSEWVPIKWLDSPSKYDCNNFLSPSTFIPCIFWLLENTDPLHAGSTPFLSAQSHESAMLCTQYFFYFPPYLS